MLDVLKVVLQIQDLDVKMIRLMRLKRERQKELKNLRKIRKDLEERCHAKEQEVLSVKHLIKVAESEVDEVKDKLKKLESQQHQIKKVEEFNALSQEMSQAERERVNKEQKGHELSDQLAQEEELLDSLKETLENTKENTKELEVEILEGIEKINVEGSELSKERDLTAVKADPDVLHVYNRLIQNKKDQVVVPIENRTCGGCHILVTAQDENLVRRAERLIFCEHCSRIQYWPDSTPIGIGAEDAKPTRRRRRTKTGT